MADEDYPAFKIVSKISDPPTLTDEDIERIEQESRRNSEAFHERTKHMDRLTADDLRIIIR